jgi:hypothetical protein
MSTMKVMVLNAQRAQGVSQKNNSEYDICTVTFGSPVQRVQRDNRQVTGYGMNANEVGLDPAALKDFAAYTYPCELDLIIEPDPRNINRNICKGIAK